jgi:hypothetical protein
MLSSDVESGASWSVRGSNGRGGCGDKSRELFDAPPPSDASDTAAVVSATAPASTATTMCFFIISSSRFVEPLNW